VPGGTGRNLKAYGHHILVTDEDNQKNILNILADPQTSGGLLIAVAPDSVDAFRHILVEFDLENKCNPIGVMTLNSSHLITVK